MNIARQIIVTIVGATIGAAALAQEATPDTWMNATASKSREQVQQELQQARKDGSIKSWSANYDFVGRTASAKTRDQVRAELVAARESGEYDSLNSEAYGFHIPRTPVYAKAAGQKAHQ